MIIPLMAGIIIGLFSSKKPELIIIGTLGGSILFFCGGSIEYVFIYFISVMLGVLIGSRIL